MSYDITNKLIINGDINLIQQIIGSRLSTSHEYYELDFKRTVPQPPESKNENWNWYDWCIENWGTNCNACKTVVRFMDENSVVVYFDTTSNPPDKWMKSTVEMFPTLTFRLSWIDTDYPNSGLLKGIDGNYSSEHYGNNIEMAKEFIKMEWPGLYTMYERANKIYNLQEEINVCAHEFFPNVVVKITECKENEQGFYDPVKLKISHLDPATDSDTWGIIDEPIRKNIIKKIKQIVFNHGYKTRSKEKHT